MTTDHCHRLVDLPGADGGCRSPARPRFAVAAVTSVLATVVATAVMVGSGALPARAQEVPTVLMVRNNGAYLFVPPAVTASREGRVTVCNRMTVFAGLFGATKGNQFGRLKGVRLKPGDCTTITLQNSSNAPVTASIGDEIHPGFKPLRVSVPPTAGGPSGATTATTAPATGAIGPTGWYWMDYKVNDNKFRRAVGLKFQSNGELQLVGPEPAGTLQMRLTNGQCTYVEASNRGTCQLSPQGGSATDSATGVTVAFTLARMSKADAQSTKAGLGNRDDFDAPDQTGGVAA